MSYFESGRKLIRKLKEYGYEAYFVGGCVRDYLLNIPFTDIDIATNAHPQRVLELFEARPTGIKYGTVLVLYEGFSFEVTTYRLDGKYTDSRHPNEVEFSKNLEDDLKRRDFTINALAMDDSLIITDLNLGENDLKKKIIRAVGNPDERFKEDALRILRGIYFVSKLGFTIDDDTFASMMENAFLLANISIERKYLELKKLQSGKYKKEAYEYLLETNAISYLPSLKKGVRFLVDNYVDLTLDEFFVLCFILEGKVDETWNLSNNTVAKYEKALMLSDAIENDMVNELIVYTYGLDICLLVNKINSLLNKSINQEALIKEIYDRLPIHKTCDLVFKGQDIMKMTDKKPAEWLGDLVDDIKYQVIMGNLRNDYDEIYQYTWDILSKEGVLK